MPNFSSSPSFANASSHSCDWPSRDSPANDGSCDDNVAVLVLNQFDIPYIGNPPPRGNLCGLDINNMTAVDAIKLSLAENMKDGVFYELYTNEDGFAYFQQVYPNPEVSDVEIRTCVPTSNIDNKADLVIVRGYDSPPCRSFKEFEELDWQETDSLYKYVDHCPMFATEAWRSYKDPVLETQYKDGTENLYELEKFESLSGYVIDFDGSSDPSIKYSFSNTTLKNVDLLNIGNQRRYTGSTQICNESTNTLETVTYNGYSYDLGNYEARDKFDEPWPLFLNVQNLYAVAYNIVGATLTPAYGASTSPGVFYIVDTKRKFVTIPASNWHWELQSDSSPIIHFYHRTPEEDESNFWADSNAYAPRGWSWVGEIDVNNESYRSPGSSPPGIIIPNMGGSWVTLVSKLWATVEIDRPSVHVTDPAGNALELANQLSVRYQPIVVTDKPAPVAYTFGGSAQLVDHTLDYYDSDPSTQQEVPSTLEGSTAWLQTQTTGRTVDVSLPFCDENECKTMAETIYSLQNESINTYQMVCGPTQRPKLGTRIPGYEGRVNKISYSYTDSSSYNINVTVGPTFLGAKSWGTSVWQQKTEDVSREAIIVWSSGDGTNYRVSVQGGLGIYPAINTTLAAYNVGEKVSVTIHNSPVEK